MLLLILGGGGQVGTALRERAGAAGHEVAAPSRAELDIGDEAALRLAIQGAAPAVLINCAAYTRVDKAEDDAETAFRINRDGAAHAASAAAEAGIPLIQLSTDYVFDGRKAGAYSEDDTPNPLSVYGRSKLAGEEGVRQHQRRHIILRTAWVFSPWRQNFVLTMRRLASRGRTPLRVVADQHGGPTSAAAIAACIFGILPQICGPTEPPWGTYHFCGAPPATWHEFASAILADRNDIPIEPIPTTAYPTRARRPANSVLDCARIASAFGITQPRWREELKVVLAALAENQP